MNFVFAFLIKLVDSVILFYFFIWRRQNWFWFVCYRFHFFLNFLFEIFFFVVVWEFFLTCCFVYLVYPKTYVLEGLFGFGIFFNILMLVFSDVDLNRSIHFASLSYIVCNSVIVWVIYLSWPGLNNFAGVKTERLVIMVRLMGSQIRINSRTRWCW